MCFGVLLAGQNRHPPDSKSLWSRFREPAGEATANIDKVQISLLSVSYLSSQYKTLIKVPTNIDVITMYQYSSNWRTLNSTHTTCQSVPTSCSLNIYRWSWLSESLTLTRMDSYLGKNSARSLNPHHPRSIWSYICFWIGRLQKYVIVWEKHGAWTSPSHFQLLRAGELDFCNWSSLPAAKMYPPEPH